MTDTIEYKLPICPWSIEMKKQFNSMKTEDERKIFMEVHQNSAYKNCRECSGISLGCKTYQSILEYL